MAERTLFNAGDHHLHCRWSCGCHRDKTSLVEAVAEMPGWPEEMSPELRMRVLANLPISNLQTCIPEVHSSWEQVLTKFFPCVVSWRGPPLPLPITPSPCKRNLIIFQGRKAHESLFLSLISQDCGGSDKQLLLLARVLLACRGSRLVQLPLTRGQSTAPTSSTRRRRPSIQGYRVQHLLHADDNGRPWPRMNNMGASAGGLICWPNDDHFSALQICNPLTGEFQLLPAHCRSVHPLNVILPFFFTLHMYAKDRDQDCAFGYFVILEPSSGLYRSPRNPTCIQRSHVVTRAKLPGPFSQLQVYDSSTRQWRLAPSLPRYTSDRATLHHNIIPQLMATGDFFVIDKASMKLYAYSGIKDKWESAQIAAPPPEICIKESNLKVAALRSGKIVVAEIRDKYMVPKVAMYELIENTENSTGQATKNVLQWSLVCRVEVPIDAVVRRQADKPRRKWFINSFNIVGQEGHLLWVAIGLRLPLRRMKWKKYFKEVLWQVAMVCDTGERRWNAASPYFSSSDCPTTFEFANGSFRLSCRARV